jgi:vancomycin resistance protein YoaR
MRNSSSAYSPTYRYLALIPQLSLALFGGLAVFVILLFTTLLAFNAYYAGRIYPGVNVAGIDVSGQRLEEAAALLQQRLVYPDQGRILLRDGEKSWLASPAQLGFYLDPQASAQAAYSLGRSGGPATRLLDQFESWYFGRDLAPLYVLDERATSTYLAGIAAQNDLPRVEPSIQVDGVEVRVQPGQTGRTLDIPATTEALAAQLQTLKDSQVALVIADNPPAILNVEEQAGLARQILSEPLTLQVPDAGENDPGPWKFEREDLAKMLTIERVTSPGGDSYQVGLKTDGLRSLLEEAAPKLVRYRQNARFIFNDDTRKLEVIQPARTGRALDIDSSIQAINEQLLAGKHEINLDLEYTQPEVGDDAKAKDLGITELVSSHTSYFYGSSGERMQNIEKAASRFHGLLVPPGATFSMSDALGDVSLDNGYAEALIIFGNRTVKGVGGGVCQVSTTLFRTAFFGGYPIVERYPHAYRVYYYEQTADGGNDSDLAGLDATVYAPMVDFKFANDTPYWLLMETYFSTPGRSLTWKFYSTSDGREVDWDTTGLKHVEEPPKPVYEENDELSKGEVKQVDWEVAGGDVTVTRTVTRDGQVLSEDTFVTNYIPWRAVYQYGPGTKGMPPKDGKNKDDDN